MRLSSAFLPFVCSVLLSCGVGFAAPPSGYYDPTDGLSGSALQTALHEIIDDHTVIFYSQTDEVMRVIDEDASNSSDIDIIYSSFSMSKDSLGASGSLVWNREHLWPRAYGIDSSGPDNSDLHNLYPCNAQVNSDRGSLFFDITGAGGSPNGVSPENTFDSDSWEPPDEDKGKIARAAFYMAARYDGSDSQTTNLTLSDSPSSSSSRMGILTTLLQWNRAFPPTARERERNDAIYDGVNTTAGFLKQGNRNPFVDYPELADSVFLPSDVLTWHKWRWLSFDPAELDNDSITGPLADPDGDSFVNLLEFISNTDPKNSAQFPALNVEQVDGELFLNLRVVNDLELSGYSYTVETSPSLEPNSWSDASLPIHSSQNEGMTTPLTFAIDESPSQAFWRMKVEQTSP